MGVDSTHPSLLERLRGADGEAWRVFEERYGALIRRYCRARGLQPWDAEDIHQTVLLRLSRALERGFEYQPQLGRFRDYLGRMVANAISTHLTRPSAEPRVVDDGVLNALAADPPGERDRTWEREWTQHHLRLALEKVRSSSTQQSLLVFDRLLAGDSVRTTAQAFGLSEEAVHKIKQRVRDRLRRQVLEQVREEDGLES